MGKYMEDDRRAYFRIDDTAWVLTAPFDETQPNIPEYFPELRHITAEGQLLTVDQDLKNLSEELDDKPVSRYIRLLNTKIDLFRQHLLIQQLDRLDQRPQTVTISEGGISFWSERAHTIGERVAVGLVFTPSYKAIYPKGEVVNCSGEKGGYGLHVTFVDMTEPMRQQLARHLLSQQTLQRPAKS